MSLGRPGSRAASLQLALGVIGVVGLGAFGVMLRMRSAPLASELVPPPAPSVPPADSVAEPRDAAPPEPEWTEADDAVQETLEAQREALLQKLVKFQDFSPEAIDETRKIMATERWLGQGNPKCTVHPMSRAECREIRKRSQVFPDDRARCGRKYMVPIYDPRAGESVEDAEVCIDQFEFPNIPCEYPVTWVRANVAQRLCELQGKRLCDAHEWEGACAGAVLPPEEEYAWGIRPHEDIEARRFAMQYDHNAKREVVWAYGKQKDHKKCATGSRKSPGCVFPTWEHCGTNTYPAGAFPECVSPFGVYDLHGNVAEHMNFPMNAKELASRGRLGQTEMKGSWFIFDTYEAHLDDCRWRAPDWHGGPVKQASSHMNYHLGFRCCRDLKEIEPVAEEPDLPAPTSQGDARAQEPEPDGEPIAPSGSASASVELDSEGTAPAATESNRDAGAEEPAPSSVADDELDGLDEQ